MDACPHRSPLGWDNAMTCSKIATFPYPHGQCHLQMIESLSQFVGCSFRDLRGWFKQLLFHAIIVHLMKGKQMNSYLETLKPLLQIIHPDVFVLVICVSVRLSVDLCRSWLLFSITVKEPSWTDLKRGIRYGKNMFWSQWEKYMAMPYSITKYTHR